MPVFANVQRAIEDEAKNIDRALGDRMEESGDKAGRRAGKAASKSMNEELSKASGQFERDFHKNIDGINTALEGINVKKLSNSMRREVSEIKKELAGLKDVDITAEADFRRVNAAIAELEGRLRAFRDGVKIVFRSDIDDALKGFAKIEAAKERIEDPIEIEVSADFKAAERQMSSFEKSFKKTAQRAAEHLSGSMNKEAQKLRAELKYLENLRIGVDVSADQARRELQEIARDLEKLNHDDPTIDVKVESGRAWSELSALEAALVKIDGQDVEIDIKTDRASRGLSNLFGLIQQGGADGDAAANSFRSFNVVLLALSTIGPALIPIIGGIGGALLALGPAAAVAAGGLTSVLIGFSGIKDAVTALSNQQDQLAMTSQRAAKTEASGAKQVANARRSAARAIESALERQKNAQENYANSIQDVKDAEEALREAREAAKGTGADINRQIKENALAIDQALLDEFSATVTFNSVMADGSATNAEKEQARIDMEQAKLRMEELRKEAKELAAEKKKWDKEGVNGTDAVKSAQDHLTDAIDAQKDAYEALRDAAKDVDRARADGARAVKDALDSQATSLEAVNAQQNAVDAAFSKLGASGQAFATFLFGLRQGFYDFRDDIQKVLLPSVQEAITGFLGSGNADTARRALISLADSFGRFAKALSTSFQGSAWGGFFQMLGKLGPQIQEAYGGAFIKFMEAIASILTTLAPFALQFAQAVQDIATAFADWAASKKGQDSLIAFMDWAKSIGPDVLQFLGAFARAAVAVVTALAPWGDVVLKVLTGFFDMIAGMDKTALGAILTTMIVLIAASQVAYGVMTLVMGLGALAALSIGPWIALIVLAVAAIAGLYTWNKDFRDFVKKAWKEISEAFSKAWDRIKPSLERLMDAANQLWKDVLQPLFDFLGPILLWLLVQIIPQIGWTLGVLIDSLAAFIQAFSEMIVGIVKGMVWLWGVIKRTGQNIADDMRWLWNKILKPIWNALVATVKWVGDKLKKTWNIMGDDWENLVGGMKWVWKHVLKPVWDFITDSALPALGSAFQTTVDAIKSIWDGLKQVVGAPIKFVLDTIINDGLIAGFNKVAGWVGLKGLNEIPIPTALQSYATGGVMPGYTPGRDVHSFVSPTAGRLELSGGEAVMRPEWTAAMGSGYVNQMNSLARSGGVKAVRDAMGGMGGYWLGGVLPLPGGRFSRHTTGYRGFAGDLNFGSGYDDYGMAIKAWKDGLVAQMNYIGDQSYGRWVVLNHANNQSSLYAHMSKFADIAVGNAVRAGQTVGYVGDLGNTGNPPTSHLHFEINGGAVDYADTSTKESRRGIPGWLMGIVKNPLDAVKGWIVDPIKNAADSMKGNPFFDSVTKLPLLLAKKTTDKVWDIVPGWVKTAAGWAGNAADWVVGGVDNIAGAAADAVKGGASIAGDIGGAVGDALGFKRGGVLPYNGTMKYDQGGYLPPGLTSVVNLTGRPEPVFTADQWDNMDGGAGRGGNLHYEPHFEGSNLTAEDIASDLNFTFRRISRRGKYAGVGD